MTDPRKKLVRKNAADLKQIAVERPVVSPSSLSSSSSSSSSHQVTNSSEQKAHVDHNENAPGETVRLARFPDGVTQIALDYLDGEIDLTKKFSKAELLHPTLFLGRKCQGLTSTQATHIANLILSGEKIKVEKALALVKQNPFLLRAKAIASDPLGRNVKGTALQIAAMAWDVDLKEGITNEEDRGLVERLTIAGELSKEEVAEQLFPVLFSAEAKQENEKRNQRIINAVIEFAESIIMTDLPNNWKTDKEFKRAQMICQNAINRFKKVLLPDPNELITSGYIFDTDILYAALKWFEDKKDLKGSGWSALKRDLFMINCFGSLQSAVSARDAQVINSSIGCLVDDKLIPRRSLENITDTSFFFNASSKLGYTFFLGYYGMCCHSSSDEHSLLKIIGATDIRKLIQSKNNSIAKLMQHYSDNHSMKRRCVIM